MSTDLKDAASMDKVALARRLLKTHDALRAAILDARQTTDDDGVVRFKDWLIWNDTVYRPAHADWKATIDAFREAVPDGSRHPINFRPECEAIIAAEARGDGS